MPCKVCTCNKCINYYNLNCPSCDHHLRYHSPDKGCSQPTCRCKMKPFVNWKEEDSEEVKDV